MPKPNTLIYAILIIILLGLIFLFTLISSRKSTIQKIEPSHIKITSYPTAAAPTIEIKKTGAIIEALPSEVVNAVAQERNLRKKTPFKEAEFSVEFDPANDKFIVILTEPKDKNKFAFVNWLKNNYPLVSLNRFILK